MSQRVCLVLVTAVVGFGLFVAGGGGSGQRQGGTLRLGLVPDLDSVDPAVAYATNAWMVEFATCATLYRYPDAPAPEGTVVIPEVADGFPRVSADGKTQTIALRRTYRFHTGQRITAANYLAAFNRDANPKLQSPATPYLREAVGADAVVAGKAQTVSGIRALGAYALQIRTVQPVPDLVSRLTMPFFCPIAPNTPLTEIDNPLGSGPYYIAQRVPYRQTVLERNRFYQGPRQAHVDEVVLSVENDPPACRQAVERNDLDWCGALNDVARRELAARYGVNNGRLFFHPTLSTWYFVFNRDRPAFKSLGQIPLKQAINWAIDRPALVRSFGYLGATRTDQILPPALGRKASIYPLEGVTDKSLMTATRLLAKASFKPATLVLYTTSTVRGVATAQILGYNLKRLGIETETKYFGPGVLYEKETTPGEPFDIGFGAWQADYADPIPFFLSPTVRFDRPKYTREIARIERLSGEARRRAWADLDVEMMRDDPPWAPYANSSQVDFVSQDFGCYVLQPAIGMLDIVAACKK